MLHVDVGAFEGPLDLLLRLIRKNEIHIEEIPIREITEAYLLIIEDGTSVKDEEMGDFLVLASELLYIKSRMLLPIEEDADEEDPREALIQRLRAYEAYLEVVDVLKGHECEGRIRHRKLPSDLSGFSREPIEITREVGQLVLAFQEVLRTKTQTAASREQIGELIEREVYEVETAMQTLLDARMDTPAPLAQFVRTRAIGEWIAVFIAMLELMKRNLLTVRVQKNEIWLHRRQFD